MNKEKLRQEKMIQEGLRRILRDYQNNWMEFTSYLNKEISEGKREFRILFQDPNTITIHPLNKNGGTIDFTVP